MAIVTIKFNFNIKQDLEHESINILFFTFNNSPELCILALFISDYIQIWCCVLIINNIMFYIVNKREKLILTISIEKEEKKL